MLRCCGEMIKIPKLKVGTRIDIVFENEIKKMKRSAHVMKALVYDVNDEQIIISQTSPALNGDFLNRRVLISFLDVVENRNLRFGFSARLTDFINDYKLASRQPVAALVLKQNEVPKQLDFRMYFRVKPRLQSEVSLVHRARNEKVNLLDISLGGARFICPKDYLLKPAETVKFKLFIGRLSFDLNARVCEVCEPDDESAYKNICYVSIEFEYDNKQLEAALGKAVIDIERQLLSEGKL